MRKSLLASVSGLALVATIAGASGGCNQTPAPVGTLKYPYGDYRYVAYDNAGNEVRSGAMTVTPDRSAPGHVVRTFEGGDELLVRGYQEGDVFFGQWASSADAPIAGEGKFRAYRVEAPELERGFPRGWGWASMNAWFKTGAP